MVVGGNQKKSLTLRGVDPETCMIVFKNHWAQVINSSNNHPPGFLYIYAISLPINQLTNHSRFSILRLTLSLSYFPHNGWQIKCVCLCVCVLLTQTLALEHKIHLEQTSLFARQATPPPHTHTPYLCVCVVLV